MALPKEQLLHSVEEYLTIERASEERHEYLDGYIFAMAGESPAHADISVNLVAALHGQLKGTPCRVWTKDSKVRSGPDPHPAWRKKGLFSYPDLVVVCGEIIWHDSHQDVLLNPKVVIEVLSESTSEFDRGEKFQRLQTWNPSLTDYLLVSQDQLLVEHYTRLENDDWHYRRVNDLSETLRLPSINCALALSEVYDRVSFA